VERVDEGATTVGIVGALYLGGDGLAHGYLGRPDLTAEQFVPDPFGEPGGRLYRTGDRVRMRLGGRLEFVGRTDAQVKLRGFRIEPGEIEALLARQPGVEAVVVTVREDEPGEKRLVAYFTPRPGAVLDAAALRAAARRELPDYMVPSAFVALEALPLNANGKVDRASLPGPPSAAPDAEALVLPRNATEGAIAAAWREVLHLDTVGIHDNFFDLGGHSLGLLRLHRRLKASLPDVPLKVVDLFRYPTIASLAAEMAPTADTRPSRPVRGSRSQPASGDAVAVLAMAGRFPGAADVEALWRNVAAGEESISHPSPEELERDGVPSALCRDPRYVRARGVLADADLFDAAFFGYSAREAEMIDPQQRVFLETAWTALEKAGYLGDRDGRRTGVFAGSSLNTYLAQVVARGGASLASSPLPLLLTSDKDFLTTRVSYKLDLRGPSVDVQTACSTSLVAVHMACRSLLSGECDLALAGGVSVSVPLRSGYLHEEGGIFSPDGRCRAFDREARGTLPGNGVGVVVLKRLSDAVRDGDAVLAVVRGTAINNDGALKVGFTAPGVEGQAEVIAAAHAAAGVDPATIGYVEAHGTGTTLGDPIEIKALREAFGRVPPGARCAIGSLKTNVGHLDAAAGVAGLIKAVLAVEHGEIPPSLHFESPNPGLELGEGPFYVNARHSPWPDAGGPRRAGVSSFGMGGTNAHAVLEQAPETAPGAPPRYAVQILPLSARTPEGRERRAADLADHLASHPGVSLADVAFTLQVGRRSMRHRRAVIARDGAEARRALEGKEPGLVRDGAVEGGTRSVLYLLPGQGSQRVDAGRGAYATDPVFRAEVDRGARILERPLGLDLRELLFPAEGRRDEASRRLEDTALAQPALFLVEYAFAQLWTTWGVAPTALLGHSAGELVAACLAGVFSLEDALGLVAERGRLIQAQPRGLMLAVPLSEARARELAGPEIDLAAVNGPEQCVLSGPAPRLEPVEARLAAEGIASRRLRTSHAFHSAMVEPVMEAFRDRIAAVERRAPRIPFVSNVTGTWITAEQATDPSYWAEHLRATVRFGDAIALAGRDVRSVGLEVGPGNALVRLFRRHPDCGAERVLVASAPRPETDAGTSHLEAAASLWVAGVDVDWKAVHDGEGRRRVALPAYPFERQRYWIDAPSASAAAPTPADRPSASVGDWFHRPTWRSAPPLSRELGDDGAAWLVFTGGGGLGASLAARLLATGRRVVTVTAGERYARTGPAAFQIRAGEPSDYEALLAAVAVEEPTLRVAHLWCAGPAGSELSAQASAERAVLLGFLSLTFLARAASEAPARSVHVAVVTSGMQEVAGEGLPCPERSVVLGPCRVAPQEMPGVRFRSIDVRHPAPSSDDELDALAAECVAADEGEAVVALRGRERWVQVFEPTPLPAARPRARLRDRGVYVVTGGLGGIGLALARHLAGAVRARLVLVSRSGLPPRERWVEWLEAHAPDEPTSRRIRAVRDLEGAGAEVVIESADVADFRAIEGVLARAESHFGALNGVVHSAGVAGGGVMALKTREAAERVLAPKIHGTIALAEALRDRRPDFVVLCSSLAAVLGGAGQVDYCAANAFEDAYARHRTATGSFFLSIGWDTWRETGMAVETELPEALAGARRAWLEVAGIANAEGVEAFTRALAQPLPHLLVSKTALGPRVLASASVPAPVAFAPRPAPDGPGHARPPLGQPSVGPRNEVEQVVCDLWRELLGFDGIGIHDDFFELGGHSLLATQLVNRLREWFGVPLKLEEVFEAPTVAGLSAALVGAEPQPGRVLEVARLLQGVNRLSDDEVDGLLAVPDAPAQGTP
jgi:acyl transferase domain-containing protein/acyl carrier protein